MQSHTSIELPLDAKKSGNAKNSRSMIHYYSVGMTYRKEYISLYRRELAVCVDNTDISGCRIAREVVVLGVLN